MFTSDEGIVLFCVKLKQPYVDAHDKLCMVNALRFKVSFHNLLRGLGLI